MHWCYVDYERKNVDDERFDGAVEKIRAAPELPETGYSCLEHGLGRLFPEIVNDLSPIAIIRLYAQDRANLSKVVVNECGLPLDVTKFKEVEPEVTER